nr:hypothetical protein [Salmonid herpesvirus 1]
MAFAWKYVVAFIQGLTLLFNLFLATLAAMLLGSSILADQKQRRGTQMEGTVSIRTLRVCIFATLCVSWNLGLLLGSCVPIYGIRMLGIFRCTREENPKESTGEAPETVAVEMRPIQTVVRHPTNGGSVYQNEGVRRTDSVNTHVYNQIRDSFWSNMETVGAAPYMNISGVSENPNTLIPPMVRGFPPIITIPQSPPPAPPATSMGETTPSDDSVTLRSLPLSPTSTNERSSQQTLFSGAICHVLGSFKRSGSSNLRSSILRRGHTYQRSCQRTNSLDGHGLPHSPRVSFRDDSRGRDHAKGTRNVSHPLATRSSVSSNGTTVGQSVDGPVEFFDI